MNFREWWNSAAKNSMWLNPFSHIAIMRQISKKGYCTAEDVRSLRAEPKYEEDLDSSSDILRDFVRQREAAAKKHSPFLLLWAIIYRCNTKDFYKTCILATLYIIAACMNQVAFANLMAVLSADFSQLIVYDKNRPPSKSSALIFFCTTSVCSSVLSYETSLFSMVMGVKVRMQIIWTVHKTLLQSKAAVASEFDSGEVVSLAGLDALGVEWFLWNYMYVWTSVIEAAFCFVLACTQVGIGGGCFALIPLGVMFGFKMLVTKISGRKQNASRKINSKRFSLFSEYISANTVVKLMDTTDLMLENMRMLRKKEQRRLLWVATSNAMSVWLTITLSPMMAWVSMVARFNETKYVSSSAIMTALGYYRTIVTEDLYNITNALQDYELAIVACTQLYSLLAITTLPTAVAASESPPPTNEDEQQQKQRQTTDGSLIQFENSQFAWSLDADAEPILCNINLALPHDDKLIGISGSIGGGKTSFLYAMLDEMYQTSGKVQRHPDWGKTVAVSTQRPWLQTGTVRDNICFSQNYMSNNNDDKNIMDGETWLETVIEGCGLRADLDNFQDGLGVNHFVGENGTSLSGGQKARVALARAIYAHANITCLDDPLSALDPSAAATIFRAIMGPGGLARGPGRTVIYVTTNPELLAECDIVLVVDNKTVSTGGQVAVATSPSMQTPNVMHAPRKLHLSNSILDEEKAPLIEDAVRYFQEFGGGRDMAAFRALTSLVSRKKEGESDAEMLKSGFEGEEEGKEEEGGKGDGEGEEKEENMGVITGVKLRQRSHFQAMVYALGWWGLLTGGTLMALAQACVFLWQFVLQLWLDSYRSPDQFHALKKSSICLMIPIFIFAVFGALVHFFSYLVSSTRMQSRCFHAVLHSPYSFFSTNPVARIHSTIAQDSQGSEYLFAIAMARVWSFGAQLIGTVVVATIPMWQMIFLFVPLAIAFFIIERVYSKSCLPMAELEGSTQGPVMATIASSTTGVHIVRAFRNKAAQNNLLFRRLLDHRAAAQSVVYVVSWLTFMADVAMYDSIAIIVSILITMIFEPGPSSLGPLVLSNVVSISGVIGVAALQLSDAEISLTALQRLALFTELPDEVETVRGTGTDNDGEGNTERVLCHVITPPPKDWPSAGRIEFRHVSAAYSLSSPPALHNVNLVIPAGTSCALVGGSGSGKSTSFLALTGLIPVVGGHIMIDGIDTASISLRDLRASIAVVPQEPVIFSGSLRSNLDPHGTCTGGEEQLWHALQMVHMEEAVREAGGLDVDSTKSRMSMGQKQLLCLARAMLRDSTVMLLDEANASVDNETEGHMTQVIANFAAGKITVGVESEPRKRTVVEVAHRLAGVMEMDQVCVLAGGKVVEIGPPKVLAHKKTGGAFYGLLQTQSGGRRSRK